MDKEETEDIKGYLVRMTPDLREQAGKDAKKLGLSFSAYVRYLISRQAEDNTKGRG